MKSVLLTRLVLVVLAVTSSAFAGSVEPVTQPTFTVQPILAPADVNIEPTLCAPTTQKVCETQEVKVETNSISTPEIKVEAQPD